MKLTDKKRTNPTKDEKLAATLLQLKRCHLDTDELVPLINREDAKAMTAQEIIAAVDFDHWPVAVSLGGTNHPTNLVPKLRVDHRKKTATKDAKINAKLRRILTKEEIKKDLKKRQEAEFRTKVLTPNAETKAAIEDARRGKTTPWPSMQKMVENREKKKKKWPSKPIDGSKASGFKKPMRGKAVKREKAE